jgi:hypothetical protein
MEDGSLGPLGLWAGVGHGVLVLGLRMLRAVFGEGCTGDEAERSMLMRLWEEIGEPNFSAWKST